MFHLLMNISPFFKFKYLQCFFLLTISGRWLSVRRTFKNFISMEEKLRNELVFTIKRVMFATVFPTFRELNFCCCSFSKFRPQLDN